MKTVTTSLRRGLAPGLWFCLGLTSLAFAQTSPPPASAESQGKSGDAVVLSPFSVTEDSDKGYMSRNTISGTGTNETLMRIPQTIQIANQEMLRDLAADDPMSAIEMAAGSAVRRSYNPGDDTFIWGFRLQSNLKDSLPYTTNAIGTLFDVDRIEVIKGPAAMMFGQNSYTGGVINYVTKKPTKTRRFSTRATLGSFNYRQFAVDASGPIANSFRYRLDAGTTDSDFGPRKFGQIKDRFIGGGVEYDISPKTKLAADFSYGTSNSVRPKTIIDPATFKMIDKPRDYSIILPWQTYPITQARGVATLTTALSPQLDSRTFVGYNDSTNDWVRDLVSSINPTAHTLTKSAAEFDTSAHYFSFGQDFVLRLATGPVNHKLIFGGDQRDDTTHQLSIPLTLSTTSFNYLDPVYTATAGKSTTAPNEVSITSRTSGLYAQEQLSFWQDRVMLLGGARYNDFFQKSGVINGFLGTATVSQGSKSITRWGAIFQPFGPMLTAYYNRSQSFLFNGGVDYLNRPLKPSTGINNEYGVKTLLLDGAVAVSATYFDIDLTNVRVVFTEGPNDPNPGASAAKQDGRQTNKGFDVSASLSHEIGPGVANLMTTVYKGNTLSEAHVKPAAAVNHTYSILGSYGLEKGAAKGLRFGAGYVFKGERIVPTASGYPTGVVLKLPSYEVVRAFASYTWRRFNLQLNVENLFDKIYVQGAESAVWVQTDPGRVIKGTVTYRF